MVYFKVELAKSHYVATAEGEVYLTGSNSVCCFLQLSGLNAWQGLREECKHELDSADAA